MLHNLKLFEGDIGKAKLKFSMICNFLCIFFIFSVYYNSKKFPKLNIFILSSEMIPTYCLLAYFLPACLLFAYLLITLLLADSAPFTTFSTVGSVGWRMGGRVGVESETNVKPAKLSRRYSKG